MTRKYIGPAQKISLALTSTNLEITEHTLVNSWQENFTFRIRIVCVLHNVHAISHSVSNKNYKILNITWNLVILSITYDERVLNNLQIKCKLCFYKAEDLNL